MFSDKLDITDLKGAHREMQENYMHDTAAVLH